MSASEDLEPLREPYPDWFRNCFDVPREERFVECDGVPIHYFRWGDPSHPGVVLTHGFMAHARCWAFIAPLLAERYCLAAFDLSGMGDSGWRPGYAIEVRAEEARAVAEHAGLLESGRRPALVCHSYGGSVGMQAVEARPDAWSALLVCDMTLLAPGESSMFEERRRQQMARGVRPHRVAPDLESALARFRLRPEQPCANRYLVEYMAHHSLKQVEGGWVWKFDPAIMAPDDERNAEWWQSLAGRFADLDLPRAIIYGEHSEMFGPDAARFIRDRARDPIPMVRVPNAYHHIMLDEPIAFAATIDALLQSLAGPA